MSAQIYLKQDNKWKPFELETAETNQILQEKRIADAQKAAALAKSRAKILSSR